MKLFTRRRALAGGAALLGAAAFEGATLAGACDHRRGGVPPPVSRDRYAASLERLSDAAVAAGAFIHVGHSTHLLSVGGARMLTDPWFYDPAFGALSHIAAPAAAPEALGALDAVLITHDHADHADLKALDRMDKRATVVVDAPDLAAKVRACGFAATHVLAEWESLTIHGATITAVPGRHDIHEVGYVVEAAGRCVYFAGDTRLWEGIAEIAERFRPSLAILPVDGTKLRTASLQVMTPDDAVTAARTLRAKTVVPSHAEAYFSDPFAGTVIATTIEGAPALFAGAMARALPDVTCSVPAPGELVLVPQ
jgi:L-ascorbate metabolism protein UlaG (beta-lactamase superfamily)